MWLINTSTMKLEAFPDETRVKYAILSHRWEGTEISFKDPLDQCEDPEKASSYSKLWECCNQARNDDLYYVWIDTCCIDKRSSAELQEAINSMYRWYSKAVICYAYLSDVQLSVRDPDDDPDFAQSAWFTRGWTLQELLAPGVVVFFERDWIRFGTRRQLAEKLSDITGIDTDILQHGFSPSSDERQIPVCTIMSWARGRQTTRLEDRAYSLMGLFDVNMPMLYGEGEKAFIRLQEEIIRVTNDQTVFAWCGPSRVPAGCFATSPDQYVPLARHSRGEQPSMWHQSSQLAMTNQGISMHVRLLPWQPFVYLALLNMCMSQLTDDYPYSLSRTLGIFLIPLKGEGQFMRATDRRLGVWENSFSSVNVDPEDPGALEQAMIVRNAPMSHQMDSNYYPRPQWGYSVFISGEWRYTACLVPDVDGRLVPDWATLPNSKDGHWWGRNFHFASTDGYSEQSECITFNLDRDEQTLSGLTIQLALSNKFNPYCSISLLSENSFDDFAGLQSANFHTRVAEHRLLNRLQIINITSGEALVPDNREVMYLRSSNFGRRIPDPGNFLISATIRLGESGGDAVDLSVIIIAPHSSPGYWDCILQTESRPDL